MSTTSSTTFDDDRYQDAFPMPLIDTSNLAGRSLLMRTPEDSQCLCVKIVKSLDNHQDDLKKDPALKEFSITNKDDIVEEIMRHNEILDHI